MFNKFYLLTKSSVYSYQKKKKRIVFITHTLLHKHLNTHEKKTEIVGWDHDFKLKIVTSSYSDTTRFGR